MSDLILKRTENWQTFDVQIGDKRIEGEITNRSNDGGFCYKTDDYSHELSAEEMRRIADKLDELNTI